MRRAELWLCGFVQALVGVVLVFAHIEDPVAWGLGAVFVWAGFYTMGRAA